MLRYKLENIENIEDRHVSPNRPLALARQRELNNEESGQKKDMSPRGQDESRHMELYRTHTFGRALFHPMVSLDPKRCRSDAFAEI